MHLARWGRKRRIAFSCPNLTSCFVHSHTIICVSLFVMHLLQVPAVPNLTVVDVTGCGNVFCGAFLAALGPGGASLAEAGAWGCAAGSIFAEWNGVPEATPLAMYQLARERVELLMSLVATRDAAP